MAKNGHQFLKVKGWHHHCCRPKWHQS